MTGILLLNQRLGNISRATNNIGVNGQPLQTGSYPAGRHSAGVERSLEAEHVLTIPSCRRAFCCFRRPRRGVDRRSRDRTARPTDRGGRTDGRATASAARRLRVDSPKTAGHGQSSFAADRARRPCSSSPGSLKALGLLRRLSAADDRVCANGAKCILLLVSLMRMRSRDGNVVTAIISAAPGRSSDRTLQHYRQHGDEKVIA